MNEQQYFFDNLKELTDAPKKGKKAKDGKFYTDTNCVKLQRKNKNGITRKS